jgi:hypothetical protein
MVVVLEVSCDIVASPVVGRKRSPSPRGPSVFSTIPPSIGRIGRGDMIDSRFDRTLHSEAGRRRPERIECLRADPQSKSINCEGGLAMSTQMLEKVQELEDRVDELRGHL